MACKTQASIADQYVCLSVACSWNMYDGNVVLHEDDVKMLCHSSAHFSAFKCLETCRTQLSVVFCCKSP